MQPRTGLPVNLYYVASIVVWPELLKNAWLAKYLFMSSCAHTDRQTDRSDLFSFHTGTTHTCTRTYVHAYLLLNKEEIYVLGVKEMLTRNTYIHTYIASQLDD